MSNPLEPSIIILLVTSLIAFSVLILVFDRRKRWRAKQRFAMGLIWLKLFRQLLSLVQQHRGLSNGYLNGDQALQVRLKPLQIEIEQTIQTLISRGDWLVDNQAWDGISAHWSRLATGFKGLTPQNNLEQHTKLIMNILYLIDDCAEQHRLYEMRDQHQRSIRYLWQTLLVTTENIGQARAIGTGVAASGECSSVDRIRLNYLHQTIHGVTEDGDAAHHSSVNHLLELLQQKVIIETPAVSAKDYFDVATMALDEVLAVFDATLFELQASLAR